MLERLAAWFLNTYVAEYVGNLNTDQLSIGLLQGAVELEKLPLKKDAFRRLNLPVDIKTGFIGKLKIEIPLTRIKSQAWVVHIDQLYLVAAPSQLTEHNEEEEEARCQDQKQRKLAKLEEQWRAEVQKGSWWSAFSLPTAFLANIVHNIQIKITDVHIRYEDEEACPGLPFAVGVTVESISAQTTNDQWEPTFVTGSSDQKKLFDCRNLSIYWDTNMAGDVESGPELVDVLRTMVPPVTSGTWEEMSSAVIAGQQPSTYIVNPVNGQIRLTWNKTQRALQSADGPRLLADVLLDEVSVNLSERQYHSFLNLVDELQMRRRAVAVAQWRPRTAVKEDPASWWRFAYNVALRQVTEHRKRQTWTFVVSRAQLNVRYVQAYTRKLTEQVVDSDTSALLSTVEKELTFEELYLLRGITMAKVNRKRATVQTPATASTEHSFLERWLPGWSSSYTVGGDSKEGEGLISPTLEDKGQPSFQKQQSIKEEDEFLQALGFEDKAQTLTRDRTFGRISFTLGQGSLKLTPTPKPNEPFNCEPILELKFSSLQTSVELAPKVKETSFALSLGSVEVVDHQHADSLFPVLLQERNGSGTSGEPVLALTLKRESVKHTPIWNITATSRPLDVVLNSVVLLQLREFFVRKDQFGLPLDWTEQVRRRLRELRARTAAELKSQIEELLDVEVKSSRAKLNINLDITAPQFILPQSLTDPDASVVILDLGHIMCSNVKPGTELPSSSSVVSEGSMEEQLRDWDEEDDEDEFLTPPSTPPSAEGESTDGLSRPVDAGLVGKALKSTYDPYDRYHLQCAELQVMVVKAKEMNSESLHTFHSRHHLLDRFTLSLELKRRLRFTSDPMQANKLVSVNLPLLSLHVDEDKVYGLLVCIRQLLPASGDGGEGSGSVAEASLTAGSKEINQGSGVFSEETLFTSAFQNLPTDASDPLVDSSPKKKALERMESLRHSVRMAKGSTFDSSEYELVFAKSVLLDVEFTVGRVMLTLCSRGREALELSVAEVQAGFVKRPYDFKGKFVVGDMVVVDRIQRFGPQYELLACSSGHRLLPLSPDSTIIERSRKSQSSVSSPAEEKRDLELLRNLIFMQPDPDQSVMLIVEVCQLESHSPDHPDSGEVESLRKADIHCEGIDIMANSSTIAEVIAFVKRSVPADLTSRGGRVQVPHPHPPNLKNVKAATHTASKTFLDVSTVGSFFFGRLNVRVIRGTPLGPAPLDLSVMSPPVMDHEQCHVVGIVTVSGMHIDLTVDSDVTMTARLCHVEVTDCTVGGAKYPVICKAGKLQGGTAGDVLSPLPSLGDRSGRETESEAVLVTFSRPSASHNSSPPCDKLTINVASVHYTHSVTFVSEVQGFVCDFQVSLAKMRDSIKDAAVGVAKGLVRQVTNPFGSEMDESFSLPTTGSLVADTFTLGDTPPPPTTHHHLFDIKVATPVVILPKSSNSEDCVIIHLGQISLDNRLLPYRRSEDQISNLDPSQEDTHYEEIAVEIANVSMQAVSGFDLSCYVPTGELHCSAQNQRCFKIVNEVSATVTIQRGIDGLKVWQQDKVDNGGQKGEGWDMDDSFGIHQAERKELQFDFVVSGKVEEPINLKMSKEVLEQIKSTFRNMTRHSSSRAGALQTSDAGSSLARSSAEEDPSLGSDENASSSSNSSLALSASFVLPKLSLELEHFENKRFVFVVMQDFAVEAAKRQPFEMEFNLKLGSIVIEDLLQSEDSKYRYIFLTSSKLFPNTPVVSSLGRSALRGMTKYMATPTFPAHLFARPAASSSPKKRRGSHTESPLRAFSRSATSVDGGSRGVGSDSQPHPSLEVESDTFICIKGLLVDENSPNFTSKYDSVTVHAEADFSAASVTINLQTWVLLLDFLGIGTPTPPPSRPASPSPEELGRRASSSVTSPVVFTEQQQASTPLQSSMMIKDLMEQDAEMFYSLGPKQHTAASVPRPSTLAPSDTGGMMGKIPENESYPDQEEDSGVRSIWGDETKMKMKLFVHFQSLDVTFNKEEYPLVKGTVSGLEVSLNVEKGNVAAEGGLALISVVDLTDKGHYYRDRFATTGQQALRFKVFKYGKPDPNMEREWDMNVEVELGSVRYLHTMRFLKEVLAFCMHFPQLIDAFQRMKELARGRLNYEGPTRKQRISFKVDAEEAYLLIPRHAEDPYLIVGDIGRFTVRNHFLYDGEEGTFTHRHTDRRADQQNRQPKGQSNVTSDRARPGRPSSAPGSSKSRLVSTPSPGNKLKQSASLFSEADRGRRTVEECVASFQGPCLLDCIEVKLMDVDVFTARRVAFKDRGGHHSYRIIRELGKVLKAKSALDLFIERNLHENLCRDVPDLLVDGVLKATHGMVDKGQLELIKGLIEKNLGEPIEQFETPSSVIKDPVALPLPSERWTTFLFNIELENVQLDFLQSRCCHDNGEGMDEDLYLARADLQASNFSFEAFSDQCKKVDFVTHSAVGYDARYEGYEESVKPNVFVELIKPRLADTQRRKKSIQGEIHVVVTPAKIDASILIHKVRLMGILDLILELKTFIIDSLPEDDCNNPFGEDSDFEDVDGRSELPLAAADGRQERSVGEGAVRQAVLQLKAFGQEAEAPSPPRAVAIKLSITETDLVVVEDLTRLDSSAIVMKGTLLLNFKMDASKEKSLYCTVQNLELFSCSLASEQSTALSILEPVSINVEVSPPDVRSSVRSPPEESAKSKALHNRMVPDAHTLKFELPDIQLKFSYRDLKMLAAITKSITRMREAARGQEGIYSTGAPSSSPSASVVSGNSHAEMVKKEQEGQDHGEESDKPFRIRNILVDVSSLSVCVIDDCLFQNVPLVRVTAKKLQLEHYLRVDPEGAAVAVLAAEYFNRTISQWEPLLEEWGFRVNWKKLHKFHTDLDSNQQADMLNVKLTSKHQLLLNVTSSLVQLMRTTHSSWSQDLFGSEESPPLAKLQHTSSVKLSEMPPSLALLHSVGHLSQQSKRTPFVPYLLRNNTGLPLTFAKMTSLPNVVVMVGSAPSPGNSVYLNPMRSISGDTSQSLLVTSLEETSEWQEVPPGGEIPFDFETVKNSIRQRNTSDLVVHQILVQVRGWKRITFPVSVDRVGVVFRDVHPEDAPEDSLVGLSQAQRAARLVFAISLDDAQKVINVRSPLVLNNITELPLEVRLQASAVAHGNSKYSIRKGTDNVELGPVAPGGHLSIPLHLTDWDIRVRPKNWGVRFCSEPIEWSQVSDPAYNTGGTKSCDTIGDGDPFLLCASVVREGYPVDTPPLVQPGHTLTFYPPLSVVNLLPYDLHLLLSGRDRGKIIRKGEKLSHYDVAPTSSIEFSISLEDFPRSQTCKVSHSTVGMLQKVSVYDSQERALVLTVECLAKGGMALEVLISCPFWLINDTGLPLVFKQDQSPHEFANQFSEHERASNRQPLLFSYSDVDQSDLCTVRLGKETHSSGSPRWCSSFTMVRGTSFVRLFWRCDDGRPEREYQIGMDIHQCHGNMRHSRTVTFVPRYKLDNRTSHEIVFAQRFQIFTEADLERQGRILTAKPGATVTFHWPRFDLDQLLCIRIKDIHDCQWSGGFPLVNDGSLCVNMRGAMGRCIFLRTEIVNRGATSYVIFSEAANFPLPFRLENFSQVPVVCSQTSCSQGCLLNPGQIVPYAWDEPVGECTFSVQVCGVEEKPSLFKPSSFATLGYLYYENHICIAAASTFEHLPGAAASGGGVVSSSDTSVRRHISEHKEVVLDVPQGTAVVFRKKTPGVTTQLWRMAADGQLIHIASSEDSEQDMVLDVAGHLPRRAGEYVPLVLRRRTQSSRLASQTWRFTGDHLVLREVQNLCVQTKKGFESFREGADAVLGLWSKDPSMLDLQRMKPLKHRPGSGVLSVRLISDGPTHVLRIADANKKFSHLAPREVWLPGGRQEAPPKMTPQSSVVSMTEVQEEEELAASNVDVEFSLNLEQGVGISLINSLPEELLFASLRGLHADVSLVSLSHKVSLTVKEIQVDSKLYNTNFPVLLYPTPSEEEGEEVPAAELTVEHVSHHLPRTVVFKSLIMRVCELTVMLEEKLLFSLVQWAGEGLASTDKSAGSEGKEAFEMLMRRSAAPVLGSDSLLHFDTVNLSKVVIRLSMHTNSSLPPDLRQIKQSLVIPLVKFEAPLVLAKYHQRHLSGARQIVLDSIVNHYKKAIKGQSLKIVGSVDLLGNPTGLVSDIASGVSGIISQSPDVVGLFRDITHGITDSTSKLTGSASDILGKATFDSSYQDEREQISDNCQTSSDHLTAGLIGLSSGVFGGLTSIFTQPYYSAKSDGIGGLFTGIGKGVMGTFTKPVVGVLDFASSATAAIRETTSRVSRVRPDPVRLKRNCVGPSGALTPYQPTMARAQTYLRLLNDGKVDERLVAYEYLTREGPRVLISSNFVYFIKQTPPSASDVEAKIPLETLHHCRDTTSKGDGGDNAPLVVLLVEDPADPALSRTHKFRCSSEVAARKVTQLINFAKTVHEYEKTVVQSYRLQTKGIW